jgi:two-component system, LytTR family, sensor histidine kinase AlgZ
VHPFLADKKRIAIYFTLWGLAAIMYAAGMSASFHGQILACIAMAVPPVAVYSQVCLSAWYVAKAFPLQQKSVWMIVIVAIVSTGIASWIWVGLSWGWMHIVPDYIEVHFPDGPAETYIMLIHGIGDELFLVSLAFSYVFVALENFQTAERNAFDMQYLAQSAELKALRMQINPHFLFNSLNSINALISQKPEKAREMTTLLADFFRQGLQYGSKETITLSDEFSLLNNYLEIEKIRFGTRLTVEQRVDSSALPCKVPPLLLQPLLENAIKHGISNTIEGGTIRIVVEKKEDRVFLTFENPFDAEMPTKKGTGLGLDIVRKRLHAIYGKDADVQTFRHDNVFRVMLFFTVK